MGGARGWRAYDFASVSMLAPGLGSLERPMMRANLEWGRSERREGEEGGRTNRSRQLPTAISSVSPKMRYRC